MCEKDLCRLSRSNPRMQLLLATKPAASYREGVSRLLSFPMGPARVPHDRATLREPVEVVSGPPRKYDGFSDPPASMFQTPLLQFPPKPRDHASGPRAVRRCPLRVVREV